MGRPLHVAGKSPTGTRDDIIGSPITVLPPQPEAALSLCASAEAGGLWRRVSWRENSALHTHCIPLPRHSRPDKVSLEASAAFGPSSCWSSLCRIRKSSSLPQGVYGYDEQGFFRRESANHVNWSSVGSRAVNTISCASRISGQPLPYPPLENGIFNIKALQPICPHQIGRAHV